MDRLFEHFFERSPLTMGDGGMFDPAIEMADTNDIDLQKRNWKFEAGFYELTGVFLPVPLPNN
jgi:hypothetical protein